MHSSVKRYEDVPMDEKQAPMLLKKPGKRGRPRKHPLPSCHEPPQPSTSYGPSGPTLSDKAERCTALGPGVTRGDHVMEEVSGLPGSARHMRNLAEKLRRDKLNTYVGELASIIPLVAAAGKKVDKTSVLRIAANYIRMHNVLGAGASHKPLLPPNLGSEAAAGVIKALGSPVLYGVTFLTLLSSAKALGNPVLYGVTCLDGIEEFFGHSQLELLGSSIFPIIHPDDHELFRAQLQPKESTRRSFFCRMAERCLARGDSRRYEIIHVQGHLRPIPPPPGPPLLLKSEDDGDMAASGGASPPVRHRRSTRHYGSLSLSQPSEDDSSGSEEVMREQARESHLLVSLVQLIKERPITELSRLETMKDEYITRHDVYGNILYTDHRISVVTGHMPEAVRGASAFMYMHRSDMLWSLLAQKHMFSTDQGQGVVSYRLRCSDNSFITLRSRGFLEVCKQTGKLESFVCINSVVSDRNADEEIRGQRRKLLPLFSGCNANELLTNITSEFPPELMEMIMRTLGPERIMKMLSSVARSAPPSKDPSAPSTSSCATLKELGLDELEEPPSPVVSAENVPPKPCKRPRLCNQRSQEGASTSQCGRFVAPNETVLSTTSKLDPLDDRGLQRSSNKTDVNNCDSREVKKCCRPSDLTGSFNVEMTPVANASVSPPQCYESLSYSATPEKPMPIPNQISPFQNDASCRTLIQNRSIDLQMKTPIVLKTSQQMSGSTSKACDFTPIGMDCSELVVQMSSHQKLLSENLNEGTWKTLKGTEETHHTTVGVASHHQPGSYFFNSGNMGIANTQMSSSLNYGIGTCHQMRPSLTQTNSRFDNRAECFPEITEDFRSRSSFCDSMKGTTNCDRRLSQPLLQAPSVSPESNQDCLFFPCPEPSLYSDSFSYSCTQPPLTPNPRLCQDFPASPPLELFSPSCIASSLTSNNDNSDKRFTQQPLIKTVQPSWSRNHGPYVSQLPVLKFTPSIGKDNHMNMSGHEKIKAGEMGSMYKQQFRSPNNTDCSQMNAFLEHQL
ncbi:neuronal PAS domain-containing protein 2 [Hyalella azteca]|uniref:Neuronal PAS domain-containing protein 2 n=1 Tax=Hyalella azteca TaxID=294128 RepID=A0A979FX67_HYAAZ|nr:neuronal PAS domain-containing protein 2 [Hyalella azteca]